MKFSRAIIIGIIGILFVSLVLFLNLSAILPLLDIFSSHPIYPTYNELKQHGFYAFVLPLGEVEKRSWTQTISIWSWYGHCGVLAEDTYNPLQIRYVDKDKKDVLEILLGSWGTIWDFGKPYQETEEPLSFKWAGENMLRCYSRTSSTELTDSLCRFADSWGYNVDVRSSLSVTETLKLLELLEYIGPRLETVKDPWDCGAGRWQ
jgi:hypothetical protein